MYAEGNEPVARPFDSAVFLSPTLSPTSIIGNCFSFWYYMVGSTMGTLNVYVDVNNVHVLVFHKEGMQDEKWTQYQRTLAIDYDFQVCWKNYVFLHDQSCVNISLHRIKVIP